MPPDCGAPDYRYHASSPTSARPTLAGSRGALRRLRRASWSVGKGRARLVAAHGAVIVGGGLSEGATMRRALAGLAAAALVGLAAPAQAEIRALVVAISQ